MNKVEVRRTWTRFQAQLKRAWGKMFCSGAEMKTKNDQAPPKRVRSKAAQTPKKRRTVSSVKHRGVRPRAARGK